MKAKFIPPTEPAVEDLSPAASAMQEVRSWATANKNLTALFAVGLSMLVVVLPIAAASLEARLSNQLRYHGAAAATQSLTASPNPIQICNGSSAGSTVLSWKNDSWTSFHIVRGSITGPIIYSSRWVNGSHKVDNVTNGEKFFMVAQIYTRMSVSAARARVLAEVTVTHTTQGCAGQPPAVTPPNNPPPTSNNPCDAPGIRVAGATASRSLSTNPPTLAIDNRQDTVWNAGDWPTQWIQLDLGSAYNVTGLCLYVEQTPSGQANHTISTGTSSTSLSQAAVVNESLQSGQIKFVPLSGQQARYVRVTTTASPSWVAWREVKVFGQLPGSGGGGDLPPYAQTSYYSQSVYTTPRPGVTTSISPADSIVDACGVGTSTLTITSAVDATFSVSSGDYNSGGLLPKTVRAGETATYDVIATSSQGLGFTGRSPYQGGAPGNGTAVSFELKAGSRVLAGATVHRFDHKCARSTITPAQTTIAVCNGVPSTASLKATINTGVGARVIATPAAGSSYSGPSSMDLSPGAGVDINVSASQLSNSGGVVFQVVDAKGNFIPEGHGTVYRYDDTCGARTGSVSGSINFSFPALPNTAGLVLESGGVDVAVSYLRNGTTVSHTYFASRSMSDRSVSYNASNVALGMNTPTNIAVDATLRVRATGVPVTFPSTYACSGRAVAVLGVTGPSTVTIPPINATCEATQAYQPSTLSAQVLSQPTCTSNSARISISARNNSPLPASIWRNGSTSIGGTISPNANGGGEDTITLASGQNTGTVTYSLLAQDPQTGVIQLAPAVQAIITRPSNCSPSPSPQGFISTDPSLYAYTCSEDMPIRISAYNTGTVDLVLSGPGLTPWTVRPGSSAVGGARISVGSTARYILSYGNDIVAEAVVMVIRERSDLCNTATGSISGPNTVYIPVNSVCPYTVSGTANVQATLRFATFSSGAAISPNGSARFDHNGSSNLIGQKLNYRVVANTGQELASLDVHFAASTTGGCYTD